MATPRELKKMAEDIGAIKIDLAQHKVQDEAMYKQLEEVKSGIGETNNHLRVMGERLGEYNGQLGVHIANNAELKAQSKTQAEALELIRAKFDERLQKLEVPHRVVALTYNFLKMFSYASLFVSAIYGLIRFLESHRPF